MKTKDTLNARFMTIKQAAFILLMVMTGCQYKTELPRAVLHFEMEQNASATLGEALRKYAFERNFELSDFSKDFPSGESSAYIELVNSNGTTIQAIDQMDGRRFTISLFSREERWGDYAQELFRALDSISESKTVIQYPER